MQSGTQSDKPSVTLLRVGPAELSIPPLVLSVPGDFQK